MPLTQLITYSLFNYCHKIIYNHRPISITDKIEYNLLPNNGRHVRRPRMKIVANSQKFELSLLHRGIFLYSKLPENLVTLNPKQFKSEIKLYIKYNIPIEKIPTRKDYE